MSRRTSRRDFLKQSSVLAAGVWLGTSSAKAQERPGANERLNVAIIGAGGQGGGNLNNIARTENIAFLCDVDDQRAGGAYTAHRNATRVADYRVLFDRHARNFDAVVVSTPDHHHFHATRLAILAGKHVYTEKPLTHSVWEARELKRLAVANPRVKTSMGNQGSAGGGFRAGVEIIQSGGLGDVREVHIWTNRPIWPQGQGRPGEEQQPPASLNWDLWQGPAPQRPYHRSYAPFTWRGWWDYGTGAIGDMACHTMNLPFRGFRLGAPTTVTATVSNNRQVNNESPPMGCTIVYEFPARGQLPAVRLTWYERGRPPMNLMQGQAQGESGCLIIGSRGTMYSANDYGESQVLLPAAFRENYRRPEASIPRSPGHHAEWLRACKGGANAWSNFVDHACQLTETALLGNVALRTGRPIRWDAENGRATDLPAADAFIRRQYRQGWTI